jgi:hypothetical protein
VWCTVRLDIPLGGSDKLIRITGFLDFMHPLVFKKNKVCCQYVKFTFYILLNVCIHSIYKAAVSPGSVQQVIPYH